MKSNRLLNFLFLVFFLVGCLPVLTETPSVPIKVQYSFTSQAWLGELQDCAGENVIDAEKRAIGFQELETADLILQIGDASDNAYQIGTEEIAVITHPENPIGSLNTIQVQGIFSGVIRNWSEAGGEDLGIQVWVYAAEEDIQRIFLERGLSGAPIDSFARLAASPEGMLRAIAADRSAIGVLPGSWITDEVKEVFSIIDIPVLAFIQDAAPAGITDIIACLQN